MNVKSWAILKLCKTLDQIIIPQETEDQTTLALTGVLKETFRAVDPLLGR